jgi:hypothetical protein
MMRTIKSLRHGARLKAESVGEGWIYKTGGGFCRKDVITTSK